VIASLPAEEIILVGDALEDSLTYIGEPEDIPTHIQELKRLKKMGFRKILPNHGDPEIIKRGGYDSTLIDATTEYLTLMVRRVHEPGYLDFPMEEFIGNAVRSGWINWWEPYRRVHRQNTRLVFDYYKKKEIPIIDTST
jgi:cyclase